MKQASTLCQIENEIKLILSAEETEQKEQVRNIWEAILKLNIEDDTDFFACGAGSMDVVRYYTYIFQLKIYLFVNSFFRFNANFYFITHFICKKKTI